jgi:hypothetical protein
MMSERRPAGGDVLDLHIVTSAQLFNSIDPAPFRERDLDPAVIAYMVEWVEESAGDGPLAIAVTIDQPSPDCDDPALVKAAIAENFRHLAAAKRREVSRLFRDGRISLVIGLGFVALAIAIGESIAHVISDERRAQIVADSAVIGAWVALWHPINIFLFDWWPLRRKAKLYDRLRAAEVRVVTGTAAVV